MGEADIVRSVGVFGDLSAAESAAVLERVTRHHLKRGEVLVREGEPSDAIFVVSSGRFSVFARSQPEPVAEVAVGEPVGEIGFFSGRPRTATVVAARDSEVIELDRAAFDDIVRRVPRIYETILAALAGRLAETTSRLPALSNRKAPRTIAVIAGGEGGLVPAFVERLRSVFGRRDRTLLVDSADVAARFPGKSADDPAVSQWLNTAENEHALVVYLADDAATEWTRKAIRQADQVIVAVTGAATRDLNPVEAFAFATHPQTHRRLVIVHERRQRAASGTAAWLASRPVLMHHHVALEDDLDVASLHRFISDRAIGYVAGGGGGYGPAHVGIYKAFQERGVMFDVMGGTSVGAAMTAGFAFLQTPEAIDASTRDIFVTSRGLRRRTFPRYSFLDHVAFDDAIRRGCYGIQIEDAWRTYFAVATDLSANGPYIFRTGPLWQAIRASGSIPGVLPPMFTADGRMLVDGGLTDNIPLQAMHAIKTGPNVVVHFGLPGFEAFDIDYETIPGRWPLLRRLLFARHKLPAAPGPVSVLRRSLFANKRFDLNIVGPHDLIMGPPRFPGSSFLDFDRHSEVFEAAYRWALNEIDVLAEKGDPAITAILQASK